MEITLRHILISDDVRIENNGRLIVIGLFGRDLVVSGLPAAVSLAFTAGINLPGAGSFELLGTLRRRASGEDLLSFGATGNATSAGPAYVPFRFPLVTLREVGVYDVSVMPKGQGEGVTESFEVKLAET